MDRSTRRREATHTCGSFNTTIVGHKLTTLFVSFHSSLLSCTLYEPVNVMEALSTFLKCYPSLLAAQEPEMICNTRVGWYWTFVPIKYQNQYFPGNTEAIIIIIIIIVITIAFFKMIKSPPASKIPRPWAISRIWRGSPLRVVGAVEPGHQDGADHKDDDDTCNESDLWRDHRSV